MNREIAGMGRDRRSDYVLSVRTDLDIGTRPIVESLLTSWMELEPATLRPERYGAGEPVRRNLHAPHGVADAVALWVQEGRGLIFKRKSRPHMVADFLWSTLPSTKRALFPWGCDVWLARSAGDAVAVRLLCFLIDQLKPAFASVTDEDDFRERHARQVRVRLGSTDVSGAKFCGTTVGDQLPGIYWRTYLGRGARDLLGMDPVQRLSKGFTVRCGTHELIAPFTASGDIGTKGAVLGERSVLQSIGPSRFFGGLPSEDGIRE